MTTPLHLVLFLVGTAATAVAESGDNIAATILTQQIAERICGRAVEPASRNSSSDIHNGANVVSRAGYSVTGGGRSAPQLGLLLRRSATAEETKTAFVKSKEIYHGEDVPGFGDAAYRTAMPAQFNVLKGRDWLIITAGVFPAADSALQEKASREILANLHD